LTLIDDVKAAASCLLSNEISAKHFIGYASIKKCQMTGVCKVAGCLVTEGRASALLVFALLREKTL